MRLKAISDDAPRSFPKTRVFCIATKLISYRGGVRRNQLPHPYFRSTAEKLARIAAPSKADSFKNRLNITKTKFKFRLFYHKGINRI